MKYTFPKIFYSKLFLGVVIVLLLIAFGLELQQWRGRQAINNEISHLVAEQQSLEKKNVDLEQSLQYFSSDSYKEKLAREQLGLKKDGEIVVNFPKTNEPAATVQLLSPESNPKKWWQYFLKNHN